jgi:hypothetical protein
MSTADLQYGFSFSELKQKTAALIYFTAQSQSLGEIKKNCEDHLSVSSCLSVYTFANIST